MSACRLLLVRKQTICWIWLSNPKAFHGGGRMSSNCAHGVQSCQLCRGLRLQIPFCLSLSSIGGDSTIENVTTLPSKSYCGFPCKLCAASPLDGALGPRHFISGSFTLFFFRLYSDILKKFNPHIKGMSFGRGGNQSGLNMAVSGAKIA